MTTKWTTRVPWAVLAAMLAAALLASTATAQDGAIMAGPDDLDWRPGPGSLPEGSEYVVLEGDPSQEGPFLMRLRLPAGYAIPPHTHPAIEHVTVLSGRFALGEGETTDRAAGTMYGPGGLFVMPADTAHFAWAEEDAVVQLHSNGPWGIDYLNPEDDPRE